MLSTMRPAILTPQNARNLIVFVLIAGTLTACTKSVQRNDTKGQPIALVNDDTDTVHTVARDRNVWQELLSDHNKIYRKLVHRQEGDLGIVETTTESDDPAVAAKIIDHAKSMQTRMREGAQVRVWDPVFRDLFERHQNVKLEVTPTNKGVKIVESSSDPETIALMRSHAMGVSEFVRHGHRIGQMETPRLAVGAPLPLSEVAIGGVPHKFLLSQPDANQLAMLKAQGVSKVVNFRKPNEPGTFDENAASESQGMSYCAIPYKEATELTDDVLNQARGQYQVAEREGTALALHCRTGNRVGPGWAMYLALDKGMPVNDAIASAKAVGMVDPLYESMTRDAIRRDLAKRSGASAAWTPATTLTPSQQSQQQRAEEARGQMFTQLLAALGDAMTKMGDDGKPVGAAGALSVCKEQAPMIALSVAREKGVMIGRTSDKLRNPSNAAPAWAAALIADKPAEPRIVSNADGSLGVTLPIKIASTCLACHGAPQTLDTKVRDSLASLYPKDQATGYNEGDLRGWFWVEVPPAR